MIQEHLLQNIFYENCKGCIKFLANSLGGKFSPRRRIFLSFYNVLFMPSQIKNGFQLWLSFFEIIKI